MRAEDVARTIWGHLIVLVTLAGGFYALVLYPLILDDLTKGAIIGFMGAAIQWEFNNQVATSTAKQQQTAVHNGMNGSAVIPAPVDPIP